MGLVEMGGASLQVAFRPAEDVYVLDNSWVLDMDGEREMIYAKSYMRYGQNSARTLAMETAVNKSGDAGSTLSFPCYPDGYTDKEQPELYNKDKKKKIPYKVTGSSDPEACKKIVEKLMRKDDKCDLE